MFDTHELCAFTFGRFRVSVEFKLPDLWVGAFFTRSELWLCLIPCFPIHVSSRGGAK